MSFFDALDMYYALMASPFVLAAGLFVIYLVAERIGRGVPRWGQE